MTHCDPIITPSQGRSAHLPLSGRFIVSGATWEILTNCQEILVMMEEVSQLKGNELSPVDLKLALSVDFGLPKYERQVLPHFRALEHLYYGTFGPGDSMLVDQLSRRVVGSFSPPTVRDVSYWKRVILPCLIGITSSCVGIAPVHCACVAKDQLGVLIHGESGSGKSTLALSLALNGFCYVSDDCTYISSSDGCLRCWGSSAPLKLLPEGITHFPLLAKMVPGESLNGEVAFEVDPAETFGVKRNLSCVPRWLFFIERTHESKADFLPLSPRESASRLASDLELLPHSIAPQRRYQLGVIDSLVQRGCWVLRHGLQPEALALVIDEFCSVNAGSDAHRSSQTF